MAAVEFALLLPFFILLIVSSVVLGHAMFVRTWLVAQAFSEARSCAVELERNDKVSDCVGGAEERFIKNFKEHCGSGPTLEVSTDQNVDGLDYVKVVQIEVRCQYSNGALNTIQTRLSGPLKFGNFKVSALVPYSVRSPEEALFDSGR